MAKCSICNKEIILTPSANERAKKFGGKPSDYTNLFTEHAKCALEKRERETTELMRKNSERMSANKCQYPYIDNA